MKNRFLTLLVIPAMLLVGCKGAKISEEKASELAKKISENTESLSNSSFEMSVTMKGAEGKGEEKVESNVSYTLTQDKEENMKLKVKGYEGEEKYDFVIYIVKNKTYDTVAYIKEYNVETKEYSERVYTKATDEDYSEQTASYSMIALVPAFMVAGFADPITLMESDDFKVGEEVDDGITYKTEVNYYSTGEKNLTIEANRKATSQNIPEDKETATEMKYTLTYDNLLFKKAVITGKSNYGNKTDVKSSLDIKKLTVELPSGWEKLVKKS